MRKLLLPLIAAAALFSSQASADWTGKDASAATITFKNPGVCTSVVCVPVVQIYDGTNVVTLTTAGADGASNTLTGVPMYGRNLVFNGTTWDRWTGAVTVSGGATSANQSSQITQETAINTVLGTQADAAWVSGSGTAVALLKNIAGGVAGSIPAGTALIGDVNVRQGGTALSTTNGIYSNLLQGNAVLSATNGTFANMLQGNAVISVTNPGFTEVTDGTNGAVAVKAASTAPAAADKSFVVNQSPNTADPCSFANAKLTAPISTSSGGPVSLVALSGSTKVYICSISAIADTAIKLSFIDGTGGSCASAQHAIWGSTTAASGMSLAANGGFTMGNGGGTVGVTAAASAFCLLQSGTSLVAGNITYVQQ